MDIITTRSPALRLIGLFFFVSLVCLFCSSVSAADVSAADVSAADVSAADVSAADVSAADVSAADIPPEYLLLIPLVIDDIKNSIPYITTHTTDDTLYGSVLLSMRTMTDEQKTNAALYGVTEDDVMGIVRDALLFNTVEGENSLHDPIEKIVASIPDLQKRDSRNVCLHDQIEKIVASILPNHVNDPVGDMLRKWITNGVMQTEEFVQYFDRYSDKVIPQVERVYKDILSLKIANDAAYYLNSYNQTNQECYWVTPKPPQEPYTEVEYYASKSGYDTGYDFGCFMGSDLSQMTYLPQHDDFKYIPFKNTDDHPWVTEWFEQYFKDGCEQGKDDISKKDIREQLRITNQKLNEIHETTKEIKNIATEIANNTKPKLDALDLTFKSLGTFGTVLNAGLNVARFIIKPL